MNNATELIFLGTGTSSCIPNINCLTAPPDHPPCRTCLSALTAEGQKNRRRNTGAVIRMPSPRNPEQLVTIVIDVGKTFQAAAVDYFPKFGLRKIDALLITHAHADAFNGLDDLRVWTLRGSIQSHIDIYCSEHTFNEAKRSFPYLVSKEFATGGGDVPEFRWHIIEDKVVFEIQDTGIRVTPFFVHHGRVFSAPPTTNSLPKPPVEPEVASTPAANEVQSPAIKPYLAYGFKIEEEIVYISDVSHIPEDVWPLLTSQDHKFPLLVLDCLHIREHISHLSIAQSYQVARRIPMKRCYLMGFSCDLAHEECVRIAEIIESNTRDLPEDLSEREKAGVESVKLGLSTAQSPDSLGNDSDVMWLRPAHDGLRVFIENGQVRDETYDNE